MPTGIELKRRQVVRLLKQQVAVKDIVRDLECSESWVFKCQALYRKGGEAGLCEKSRRPQRCAKQLPAAVHGAIREVRLALEQEAAAPPGLAYIGARAIRERLRRQQVAPLPSLSTIEAELRRAGLTHVRAVCHRAVHYPRLAPHQAHELVQADICPHYLPGGVLVSCFNAIDAVSHYPLGTQLLHKRATDAAAFLLQVWQEMGVPLYTQVDNESCFSGGFTHPCVLGQVVRLGLWAGTQLVFSPPYHPQSNGTVERFHQEYSRHVWNRQTFCTLTELQGASAGFFAAYCTSTHHEALKGCTPRSLHQQHAGAALPTLQPPHPLPLMSGHVHFMRHVSATRQVHVLNVHWPVPDALPDQGVWVTLDFTTKGTSLAVFDAAPTAPTRRCLAVHPFPLREPVLVHPQHLPPTASVPTQPPTTSSRPPRSAVALLYDVFKVVPVVKELLHSTMS
jgi:transposase InsO family protein